MPASSRLPIAGPIPSLRAGRHILAGPPCCGDQPKARLLQASRAAWLLAAASILCLAPDAHATSLVVGVQDRRLEIDASFAEDPVENDQTSVRATYTWDLSQSVTLIATGGAASSYLGLNDTRINGATDVRVRALYRPNDRWVFGAGSIVPFGLYELSANEVTAAQWVWNPRSGFPLSRFGEGWGWELTSAYAAPLSGDATLGLAAGYLRHAEFDLLGSETGPYRLGDEISLSGAIDWRLPGDGSLLLNAAYRTFASDELLGEEFLEKGDQIAFGASAGLPMGSFYTRLGVRASLQGDNRFARAEGDTLGISESGGTRLGLEARLARSLGEAVLLYADGLVSVVSGSDYALPVDGTAFSFGPGIGWRASDPFSLGLRFLYLTSSGDDDLDYTGTDLLLTLEYRP